jgi:hypothetical protein
MQLISVLFTVLVLLLGPVLSFAQSDSSDVEIGLVKVEGSIRTRVYGWDWFQDSTYENAYTYPGTLIRLSFSQQRRDFDWNFEFGAPVLLDLPNDAVAPAPPGQLGLGAAYFAANHKSQNTAMVFPKQAYIRLKHLGGDEGQSLQIGRFEFLDGSEVTPVNATLASLKKDRIVQRLIGNYGFSDVERSFDGLHYVFSRPAINFTVVGAVPTRGVFQTDGWGWIDTAFAYSALTGQVKPASKAPGEWRVFGVYYDDWRHVLKTDDRPTAMRTLDMGNIRIGTLGGHYLQAFETKPATVDLMAWAAVQTGTWGSQGDKASVIAGEAGIQPAVLKSIRPWLRTGYLRSSGDSNPADNTHGTFFQLLPTPRPYARFPFFNMMNNEDGFVELMLRPGKTVTIRGDVHTLRLTNSNDLWYAGGGAFQPWTFGYTGRPSSGARSLATLYDTSVDYNLGPQASVGIYYGYADGKSVIQHIFPQDSSGQLGFLELNYRF